MSLVRNTALTLALLAPQSIFATTNEIVLGIGGGHEFNAFSDLLPTASYQFSSGDALIANFSGSARIGKIAGGKNVVVIPEVSAFGQTIVPEIRADTRSGLRLSADFDAYAGLEITAGIETGSGIDLGFNAGPKLFLPSEVRAGRFFSMRGETFVSDAHLDVDLPSLNAGLDVLLGGNASGKLEYGLFPVAGYQVGEFNFNLPDIRLPTFDFNFDLNLPDFPDFNFLGISLPVSDTDDTAARFKLPPNNVALNAGEIALVNPISSASTTTTIDDNAIINTTNGEIARVGLDLDGLASYALSGASFTGLELPVEVGETKLATIKYDTIDVKYGLELGYEVENRLDTFLEVTLNFLDPNSMEATDILIRNGEDVGIGNTWSGRFDQLPDLSLLSAEDVLLDFDFTGLKRELSQRGALTLSDYMEFRALAIKAQIAPGIGIGLGPVFYKKLSLFGELGSLDLYNAELTLSDFNLPSNLFDDQVLLSAVPTVDAYVEGSSPYVRNDLLTFPNTMRPTSLADTVVTLAKRAPGMGFPTSADELVSMQFADEGGLASDATVQLSGLIIPEGSSLFLSDHVRDNPTRHLKLLTIENDGFIGGSDGTLTIGTPDPDGRLTISGSGEIWFGHFGGIDTGTLVHEQGHRILYGFSNGPGAQNRYLKATQMIDNAGIIDVAGGTIAFNTALTQNRAGGQIRARDQGTVLIEGDLINAGTIAAIGPDARVHVQAFPLDGGEDGKPGIFSAERGGMIEFDGFFFTDNINQMPETRVSGDLDFIAGADGTIRFNDQLALDSGHVRLITEQDGTIELNGLIRESTEDTIFIHNRGLLDVVSGKTSLRVTPPPCTGNCGNADPVSFGEIRPVDLINEGTIRVRAGAEFAFDVDIVDYGDGGATLKGGTWELLGANTVFRNNTVVDDPGTINGTGVSESDVAVIDVRVSDVFGNADKFGDLLFSSSIDPVTEEEITSGISELNTDLLVNEANVLLSGAAKFDYFNTVEINRGSFTLQNQRDFTTVGSYTNDGGSTRVESGARLVVSDALIVNGGNVTIDGDSTLRVNGVVESINDGPAVRRDIEVNGGSLVIADGASLDGGLVNIFSPISGPRAGLELSSGRSWIVRDAVDSDELGNEVITPGLIDLAIRTSPDFTIPGDIGLQGVTTNRADVLIEGAQAEFRGFESRLNRNRGTLTLRGGKVFDTDELSFSNSGTVNLEGAQFLIEGGRFSNSGNLSIDKDSFLKADSFFVTRGEIFIEGVIQTNSTRIFGGTITFSDGVLYTGSVSTTGDFTIQGGTLFTPQFDGSLMVESGTFAPGQSIAATEVDGDYSQGADGVLEIEWDSNGADFLTVTGEANLAGTLALSLLDDYIPEIGTSLEFLSAASIIGTFDNISILPPEVVGLLFSVRQEGSSLFVDVAAVPVPAALWFLLSGFGLLVRSRRSARG